MKHITTLKIFKNYLKLIFFIFKDEFHSLYTDNVYFKIFLIQKEKFF